MPAQHVVLLLGSLTPRRSIQLKPDRQKVVFFYCFDCKKWSCSNSESESQTELCLSWEESPAETGQEAVLGVIVLFVGLCWLPRGYVLDHITLLAKLAKSKASGAGGFKINIELILFEKNKVQFDYFNSFWISDIAFIGPRSTVQHT